MPASSGHHHREPRPRKVYGKEGGPTPTGRIEHEYQPQDGWAGCSCGAWTRPGNEFITKPQWCVHVDEARGIPRYVPPEQRRQAAYVQKLLERAKGKRR